MKHNLAIGPGAKLVSRCFKFFLDRLVAVEFAVDDNSKSFVLVRDWLISGRKVDNAEPCMPECDPAVRSDPMPLAVGTAMTKTLRSPLHCPFWNRGTWRKNGDNSAHLEFSSKMQPARLFFTFANRKATAW
jgi:hypothetical protein